MSTIRAALTMSPCTARTNPPAHHEAVHDLTQHGRCWPSCARYRAARAALEPQGAR